APAFCGSYRCTLWQCGRRFRRCPGRPSPRGQSCRSSARCRVVDTPPPGVPCRRRSLPHSAAQPSCLLSNGLAFGAQFRRKFRIEAPAPAGTANEVVEGGTIRPANDRLLVRLAESERIAPAERHLIDKDGVKPAEQRRIGADPGGSFYAGQVIAGMQIEEPQPVPGGLQRLDGAARRAERCGALARTEDLAEEVPVDDAFEIGIASPAGPGKTVRTGIAELAARADG